MDCERVVDCCYEGSPRKQIDRCGVSGKRHRQPHWHTCGAVARGAYSPSPREPDPSPPRDLAFAHVSTQISKCPFGAIVSRFRSTAIHIPTKIHTKSTHPRLDAYYFIQQIKCNIIHEYNHNYNRNSFIQAHAMSSGNPCRCGHPLTPNPALFLTSAEIRACTGKVDSCRPTYQAARQCTAV